MTADCSLSLHRLLLLFRNKRLISVVTSWINLQYLVIFWFLPINANCHSSRKNGFYECIKILGLPLCMNISNLQSTLQIPQDQFWWPFVSLGIAVGVKGRNVRHFPRWHLCPLMACLTSRPISFMVAMLDQIRRVKKLLFFLKGGGHKSLWIIT